MDNPFDPTNIGEDADNPTGPLAQQGDIITYTYQATNTGNVDLTITDLVDDNFTPDDPTDDFTPEEVLVDGFNFGDVNQDGIFNPLETWYFQAKELATVGGQRTNIATITAEGIGETVTDADASNHVVNPLNIEKQVAVEPVNGGAEGQAVCETEGKPVDMVFEYNPSLIFNTQQDSSKGEGLINNGLDDDNNAFIVVTDESDITKVRNGEGDIFFSGDVTVGDQFTASIANAGSSFSSNTFFYFFDEQGGPLLQSARYHTSCSAPILLGDDIFSAELVGYRGEDSTGLVNLPSPTFVDADTVSSGPQAIVNSQVDFRYVVTNTGDTPLSNVVVTDDNKTPDDPTDDFILTLEEGDTNHNGLLDIDETWFYSSSEDAELGQQTNKATVTADFGDLELMDMDVANYEGIITPPPEGDVCDTLGDPTAITFTYEPGTDVLTGQDPSKAGIVTQNGVDDDGTSFVVVTDEDDITKVLNGEGRRFFEGDVDFGESFQATNTLDNFGSETFIHFFDDSNGPLLQSVNYHTSCSQPIQINDVIGNATLVEYFGENGAYDNPLVVV
ncbi:MAG: hypothetical protein WBM32_05115 [Crocosphaera sp.]